MKSALISTALMVVGLFPLHAGSPKSSPLDSLDPVKIHDEFRLPNQPAETVAAIRAHSRVIASLAFSPDGRTLVSAGWDNLLHLYRVSGGEIKDEATLPGSPSGLAFSADGRLVYAGGADAYVHVWDVSGTKVQERSKMSGHKNRPFALALSPDGKMLASGCGDPVLRVWKMSDGEPEAWGILENETAPSVGVSSLAFSFDGQYLAAGHHAGKSTLRIWDVAGNYMGELEFPKTEARLVAFSPKEPLLAFGADDRIRLWEIKNGKTKAKTSLAGHPDKGPGAVKALAFSPDGKWLASTGRDRRVIVWDVAAGTNVREWLSPWPARALTFGPDSRHLAVGNDGGVVFILRLPSTK